MFWTITVDGEPDTLPCRVIGDNVDQARDAGVCSLHPKVWLDDYLARQAAPDTHTPEYLDLYTRIKVTPTTPPFSLLHGGRG